MMFEANEEDAMDVKQQMARYSRNSLAMAMDEARSAHGHLPIGGRSPLRLTTERFRRDKVALAGSAFILLMALIGLAAPLIAKATGHPPNDQSHLYEMTTAGGLPKGPSIERRFYFGADQYGRDILVRVAYGARVSLVVSIGASALAMIVGVTVGLVAGYHGGIVDALLSRIVDVLLSIPILLLALALVAVLRPSGLVVVGVIVLISWTYVARIIRGLVLSLRAREFVEAQRALGASDLRIMVRDLLPNLVGSIIVYAALIIPANILFEGALSYLGFGIPPPTATWGQMLAEANQYYRVAWWMLAFPGAALLGTTLAFNMVGDGLRDALDPQSERPSRGR